MRSDSDRLDDILAAIAKIKERVADDEDAFQRDEMLQVWVIHHLQIIGEAARGISQSTKARYPDVPKAADKRITEYSGPRILWAEYAPGMDGDPEEPAHA